MMTIHGDDAKVWTALHKASASIRKAAKDSKNPHLKNRFASLESVLDAVRDPMEGAGLMVLQPYVYADGVVTVTTMLCTPDGDRMEFASQIPLAGKADAQAVGSAVTYCRRYGLMALFAMSPSDDIDDDGNKATGRRSDGSREPSRVRINKLITRAEERGILADALAKYGRDAKSLTDRDADAFQRVCVSLTAESSAERLTGGAE